MRAWQTAAMTSRRVLAAVAGLLLLAACSNETSSPGSTVPATTTTEAAPTTTAPATTTSTAAPTTTSTTTAPATTTTIAAVEGLGLSGDGLGDALFGADAQGVIDYVSSVLGAPTNDTGWIDPLSIGAACPGTEVRFVDWHDLYLFFSDETGYASDARHFAGFVYGPAFGATLTPFGLSTDAGIDVGSTVAELRAVYPSVVVNPDDELSGPNFVLDDGLFGFLSGGGDSDTVIAFQGGTGCGE